MRKCLNCQEVVDGRTDKKFCSPYCKSAFHYQDSKKSEDSTFKRIDNQLKLNRRLLKSYNKSGKSTIRKETLIQEGFNPKYITHWWKNKRGDTYLFCFEFGFLLRNENGKEKYVMVKWQAYMEHE